MDLNFHELRCPCCQGEMKAAGTHITPQVTIVKKKCINCKFTLMLVPMQKNKEYGIEVIDKK